MILNDAREKIRQKNPFLDDIKYPHHCRMAPLLSRIQARDDEAFRLSVDSLSMILDPHDGIRELGNDAAHVATEAEKTAAIMSDVDGLSTRERDCFRNIYGYAYGRPPIKPT